MKQKIFITGATGLIGYNLSKKLIDAGYEVAGLTTSENGKERLEKIGVQAFVGNIMDGPFIMEAVTAFKPEIVINQITDLKNVSMEDNANVRIVGTKNLMDAAVKNNVKKVIAQSLAFTYEPGDTLADEKTSLDTNSTGDRKVTVDGVIGLETETARIDNHVMLRFGYLYGPGTWYGKDGMIYNTFFTDEVNVHDGIVSFIHLDDAVQSSMDAINYEPGIYNVVDNQPMRYDEWAKFVSEQLNVTPEIKVEKAPKYERGATNEKFLTQGTTLKFPSWQEGINYL